MTFEQDGSIVGPFLLLVDCSGSMGPHPDASPAVAANAPIKALNDGLPKLVYSLQDDPEAAEVCCLGMVTFSTEAREHFAIRSLDEAPSPISDVNAFGTTNYAAAFRKAREVIARDVPKLGARGRRPVVIFITDGLPYHEADPDWQTPLVALRDDPNFKLRPKIAVLGFGEANRQVMEQVASSSKFVRMWDSSSTGEVVLSILSVIQRTIIRMSDPELRADGQANPDPEDLADALLNEPIAGEPADYVIEYERSDLA